ncbi:autotransporter assembly complex protein TamA [Methylophaga sp. OBS3]|uniref:autotransporter assembly complex protein TamA n=1 Tax=Methylophaga sp. OBS3 TaxID=2991934 RepID=UPI00224E306C|nr:autotransporter assembly complex family protein [Methylophaga sp. OBS3]MCX4189183.1 autotransporter assembly complex protein TamA [Methylophaga sp. OBS3]
MRLISPKILFVLIAGFFWSGFIYAEESKYEAVKAEIEITVEGVNDTIKKSIIDGLTIHRQRQSERLSERLVERLHRAAQAEITQTLSVYGYYNPEINPSLTQTEPRKWLASYQIEAGKPVRITTLNIKIHGAAEQDVAFQNFLADFPLKIDERFRHSRYESAKKSLLRIAAERGFFDGKLTCNKVEVDTEKNSATICLEYQSGDRYRFGEIQYPDTVVSEDLMKRITPFEAGEHYRADKVLALRNNLNNSGYFSETNARTLIELRHDGIVPVTIEVTPSNKHRYSAGLGFGTDTGARGSLGWQNRYVNDRGHQLSANMRLSQISNRIGADYQMPFWSENIQLVGVNTEFLQEDTDTSEKRSYTLGTYYQRERWGWEETGSIKLLQEDFDIADESESALLLIPGITFAKTWADDSLYTRQGGRLSIALSGASESLLSDISFGQVVLTGKYIQGLTKNSRLITRAQVGATSVSDFDQLPSSLRFFAGGDNSIRGFDYESLGPENDKDEVVGGRYLAVGSIEYEHMFLGDWGGAVFTDFGNAFNDWSDPIEYSVGLGVRWRSPVGLIRVDVARGLSDEDKPFALHIVIGPDL